MAKLNILLLATFIAQRPIEGPYQESWVLTILSEKVENLKIDLHTFDLYPNKFVLVSK